MSSAVAQQHQPCAEKTFVDYEFIDILGHGSFKIAYLVRSRQTKQEYVIYGPSKNDPVARNAFKESVEELYSLEKFAQTSEEYQLFSEFFLTPQCAVDFVPVEKHGLVTETSGSTARIARGTPMSEISPLSPSQQDDLAFFLCTYLLSIAPTSSTVFPHDPQLIHTDIKPENVVYLADGRIFFIDHTPPQAALLYTPIYSLLPDGYGKWKNVGRVSLQKYKAVFYWMVAFVTALTTLLTLSGYDNIVQELNERFYDAYSADYGLAVKMVASVIRPGLFGPISEQAITQLLDLVQTVFTAKNVPSIFVPQLASLMMAPSRSMSPSSSSSSSSSSSMSSYKSALSSVQNQNQNVNANVVSKNHRVNGDAFGRKCCGKLRDYRVAFTELVYTL
jgi:serine/threonine protein kinase